MPEAAAISAGLSQLARVNADNRPTLRALEQAYDIAISADDAAAAFEFLSAATRRWLRNPRFHIVTAKTSIERSRRSSGMTIDRRTFVAGTASAALAPTIALLPVQYSNSCSSLRPSCLEDRRMESPGRERHRRRGLDKDRPFVADSLAVTNSLRRHPLGVGS